MNYFENAFAALPRHANLEEVAPLFPSSLSELKI
jgi:hypothetical protein